jgi:hypothetical protein
MNSELVTVVREKWVRRGSRAEVQESRAPRSFEIPDSACAQIQWNYSELTDRPACESRHVSLFPIEQVHSNNQGKGKKAVGCVVELVPGRVVCFASMTPSLRALFEA